MNGLERAYRGLKVLDLGQGVAAPYCGMLLAMHGAEVVKLEPPEGDWSRRLGTTYGDQSAMSAVYNRGKRSLALDLKSPEALAIVKRLAAEADIMIESFRPGVAKRLGIGWEAMHALNPRLLYVSVSGFGQEGPYTGRPCSDSVAQAFSGLVSVNIGNDGTPHRLGAIIIDTLTGLYSAQTLGTALFQRERTGEGRWLDLNLTACGAAILGHKLAEHLLEGGAPRALNTPAGVYRTRDGWIMITLVRESHFHALARGVGRPELAQDPRYATFATRADHAAGLYALLREILAGDTSAHWLDRLTKEDVLVERIYGFDEWLADPHVQAIGGAVAIEQPGMGRIRTPRTPGVAAAIDVAMPPSPAVGEHGRAVLAELGFTAADIERLAEGGILHLARKAA